jgi:hypothetical protein
LFEIRFQMQKSSYLCWLSIPPRWDHLPSLSLPTRQQTALIF